MNEEKKEKSVDELMDEEVREIEKKLRVIKKQAGELINRLRNVKKAKEFYAGKSLVRKKKPEEKKEEPKQEN